MQQGIRNLAGSFIPKGTFLGQKVRFPPMSRGKFPASPFPEMYSSAMIITLNNLNKLLDKGASINGAWNSKQIRALVDNEEFYGGFPRPGWKLRLIGRELTKEQIDEFLSLKNQHLRKKMAIKELFAGTNKYNCETCFHGITHNCEDAWNSSRCCDHWFNPDSEIQGLAYQKETKVEKMPLFT